MKKFLAVAALAALVASPVLTTTASAQPRSTAVTHSHHLNADQPAGYAGWSDIYCTSCNLGSY